ncbi:MAG TPA: 50S ribosomal protein L13 [Thermoprotei archaeon]|nr:50S ribosomal protein L13 [Euryarchaeota archaeon]MCD6158216.1 50S ribosomal protein L13 [Euryarchaeota archaeon]RLF65282.1 MAG: 50S ribosomal protein L13 [Thermoplasmata archaeon]HDJ50961.1 50S ribosomal protein L13 [Thermoprotei archaeon]
MVDRFLRDLDNVTVIDATGHILGRLASIVAKRLLNGEKIVIVNAEKAIISGKREMVFEKYKQKRDIGSHRGPFFPRMPHLIVKRTIRGMLPYKQEKGKRALKNLRVYIGVPKELEGRKFEEIPEAKREVRYYVTVEELSRWLGARF